MDKSTKKLQIGLWSIVAALVVGLCCMWYYQAHHFNKNVTINGISVGKMTAKDAADHLKNVTLDNTVYVGNDVMYRGQRLLQVFPQRRWQDRSNFEETIYVRSVFGSKKL